VINNMLHGSETWPTWKENEVPLQRSEIIIDRWMCDVKVNDKEFQVKSGKRD